MTGSRIRRAALACALVLVFAGLASPALAQTGAIRGKVVDAKGTPIDRAKITFLAVSTNRKLETNTDRKGEFRQIGLPPGDYRVTAEKDGLAQTFDVKVGLDTAEVNFTLTPTSAGPDPAKEAARLEGIKAAFSEGANLTNAGKLDEAIAKFNEVLAEVPKCSECYSNLGTIYTRKQEWDKAEESFKKAIELNPVAAENYNGLATVYNAQKKFKEAQEMSAEAAKRASAATGGTLSADALYNQGVIAWNANDFAKAGEMFAEAVKVNDKHAESHFMLGQVYLNLGKLPDAAKEFETYTKIAPNGPNAQKAKEYFEMLKQYIK